jgi:hypothetical protein
VYHFKRASTNYLEWYAPLNASLIQQSNYTDALVAVGTYPGISQYGAADTAGNVREWAFNKTGRRSHAVMGGAHTQSEYMFVHTVESPPMNRDEITGFRLVQRLDPNLDEPHLYTQAMTIRDLTSEVDPVSDEVYKVLASQLVYRKRPITTEVLAFEHEHPNRRVEDIRLTTGAESLRLFIIIPDHIKPPYQAVIMFPGQDAFQFKLPVENQIRTRLLNNFLLNSGRVLIYPEYHGAHERYEGLYEMDDAEANIWYRDAVVKWRTEIGRTVDYLETRDDMSLDKVTFWGISFGTYNPISVLAVDDRFAAALLYLGGVLEHGRPPLAASYNFVPHIKIPVLQVNGRYDPIFDFETSQNRMFELLGTPAEDKELFIFEGGHVPSSQEQWQSISAKAVDWLDTRLGRP